MDTTVFAERLSELMLVEGATVKTVAKATGIDNDLIYLWLNASVLPYPANAIRLADYYRCPLEYLLGRVDEYQESYFSPPVTDFSRRLRGYVQKSGKSAYFLCKTTQIHKGTFMRWLNGTNLPQLTNLIILADYFKCSVDTLIGRLPITLS